MGLVLAAVPAPTGTGGGDIAEAAAAAAECGGCGFFETICKEYVG
jgi:hypothetical protein